MFRKIVQNLFKFILIATAIQFAATQITTTSTKDYMKELNDKLDDLQKKLDSLNNCVLSATLQTLERQQHETMASLKVVERLLNETTRLPSSCVEVFQRAHRGSGVYRIDLSETTLRPFNVYCLEDPNGGLPWTVLQRRVDNTTDFYRYWADYKQGFGNMKTNFILGLDKWHVLTTQTGPQELWVQLTDDITVNAYYDRFAIADESEKYAINVLGRYSGEAMDALSVHRGHAFSTRDMEMKSNCARTFKGAWWYRAQTIVAASWLTQCQRSNLNGEYGSTESGRGINWYFFRGETVSMKYAHMAIRPASIQ